MNESLQLLKDVLHAHGVGVRLIDSSFSNMDQADEGLRRWLYQEHSYQGIMHALLWNCQEGIVYLTQDEFMLNYYVLHLMSDTTGQSSYLVIGPFMFRDFEEVLDEVMTVNGLPLALTEELRSFYNGIPHITNTSLEYQVLIMARFVLRREDVGFDKTSLMFAPVDQEANITPESPDHFSLGVIEARYANEEKLLAAVARGDLITAKEHMAAFNRYRIERRSSNPFRDSKNYLIALNTLLRKAVQSAEVHPAHINSTSTMFINAIESARNQDDLGVLVSDMLRKYCLLVRNHSFMAYSRPIVQALNHIDFHYMEPLTLKALSQAASVSAGYLSTQFSKEVGQTVTEYIHQKRLAKAQFLLTTAPRLPINRVAEMVGFSDDTYFARLFKRYAGMTPTAYKRLYGYEGSVS